MLGGRPLGAGLPGGTRTPDPQLRSCLLYTSDAADERSSVDLGGRRIIKKKKSTRISEGRTLYHRETTQTT